MLDFYQTWLPYLYLYGVGGLAFIIGLWLIMKTKALDINKKTHKKWFYVILFGFIYYAVIHAAFILIAMGG